MKIDPKTPTPPHVAPRRDSGSVRQVTPHRATPLRTDSVALSSRGRAADGPLSAERVIEVQSRIRSRFYDSAVVATSVAERLLASGDL